MNFLVPVGTGAPDQTLLWDLKRVGFAVEKLGDALYIWREKNEMRLDMDCSNHR